MLSNNRQNIALEEKKDLFLKIYPSAGTITKAAEYVGVTYNTARRWNKDDPVFAAKFEEARQGFVEELETIAFDLIKEMASRQDYKANPTLLIFMLNGNAPHKYRGLVETSSEAREVLAEFRKMAASPEKKEPKKKIIPKNTKAKRTVLEYEEEKKALKEKFGSLNNDNPDSG